MAPALNNVFCASIFGRARYWLSCGVKIQFASFASADYAADYPDWAKSCVPDGLRSEEEHEKQGTRHDGQPKRVLIVHGKFLGGRRASIALVGFRVPCLGLSASFLFASKDTEIIARKHTVFVLLGSSAGRPASSAAASPEAFMWCIRRISPGLLLPEAMVPVSICLRSILESQDAGGPSLA